MAAKTNARQNVPVTVSSVVTPEKDICLCGHGNEHHGTGGACRFGPTHGCSTFSSK